jgi:hypothetical protein
MASASMPRDVDDLVGVRASSGERVLEYRGYMHIDPPRGPEGNWAHWWNPRSQGCLNVSVINGRCQIIDTSPASGGSQNTSASGDDDESGKAAAIAIAASVSRDPARPRPRENDRS